MIRIGDLQEQPWKNGKGTTRLIASGDGWRISLAAVSEPGVFSVFDASWRYSVVLCGSALELRSTAGTRVALRVGEIARYRGDAPWDCAIAGSSATVLNVICEDGRSEAVIRQGRAIRLRASSAPLLVLPVNCSVRCTSALRCLELAADEILMCDDPEEGPWMCSTIEYSDADAYLLAIQIDSPVAGEELAIEIHA